MSAKQTQDQSRLWIILSLTALAVGYGIFKIAGIAAAAREAQQPPREETLPLVEVVSAEERPDHFAVIEEGFLRPQSEIDVVPEVAGKVVEVSAELTPGGQLAKGDLLFRIDPRNFEAELNRAEANLASARTDLKRATDEEARQRRLEEIGAVSSARLDEAVSFLASARAALRQAEAAVVSARKALEDTAVRAPFNASVITEDVALGDYLQPGMTAATIFDTSAGEIVLDLLPTDARAVRAAAVAAEGPLKVTIRPTDASAGTVTLEGEVTRFGQSVDRNTRTVPVVVRVPNAFTGALEHAIFANDFVEVELPALSSVALYASVPGVVREERFVWTLDDDNHLVSVEVTPVQRTRDTVIFRTLEDLTNRPLVLTALTEEAEGIKVEVAPQQTSLADEQETLR